MNQNQSVVRYKEYDNPRSVNGVGVCLSLFVTKWAFPGRAAGTQHYFRPSRPSFSSILQRNPELCHGGTMTTTLKQENESHWLVVTMTRRLHTQGAFLRPS